MPNKDYKIERMEDLDRPRPGHGDLSGAIKYLTSVRAILERASARETAVRVAAGAVARQLLGRLRNRRLGYVAELGPIKIEPSPGTLEEQRAIAATRARIYSLNPEQDAEVTVRSSTPARRKATRLGGWSRFASKACPSGWATHAQWDLKLDGRVGPGGDGDPGDQGGGDRAGF